MATKRYGVLLLSLALLLAPVAARAEDFSSSSFIVRDPTISSSSNESQDSSSFQALGNAGESAVGDSASGSFRGLAGSQGNDDTPPVGGSVNDGPGADIDEQSDMVNLEANWSGFSDPESGLGKYEYRLQRIVDGQCWNDTTHAWAACSVWNDAGTSTGFSLSHANLALRTGTLYVACVRATNTLNLTGNPACSDGVSIDPSITFSYDAVTVSLGALNAGNSWNAIATTTLSVETNAYGGYSIYGSKTDLMHSVSDAAITIADVSDSGCNGSAVSWPGPKAFGFSSSDDVDGNKFHTGGTKYCAFPTTTTPTDGLMVADSAQAVTGGSLVDDNTITYRTQVDTTQPAGRYLVRVLYTVLPRY